MQAVDLLEFQVYLIRKYLRMNEEKKKTLRRRICNFTFSFIIYFLFIRKI